jgi:hypothetical protein
MNIACLFGQNMTHMSTALCGDTWREAASPPLGVGAYIGWRRATTSGSGWSSPKRWCVSLRVDTADVGAGVVLRGMRRKTARLCDIDRQTLRDWVIRYNAQGVARVSDTFPGPTAPFTPEQEAALAEQQRTRPRRGWCGALEHFAGPVNAAVRGRARETSD